MRVLAIQPGIFYPEEAIAGRHQTVRQTEGYIEIGLLSVATYLDAQGIQVRILNLEGSPNIDGTLQAAMLDHKPRLVAISCMSGYAYRRLAEVATAVREVDPRCYIITGGQHAAPLGRVVLEEIPAVDCVVAGEGEATTWAICQCLDNELSGLQKIPGIIYRSGEEIVGPSGTTERLNVDDLPYLNYNLFPSFRNFVPRLEESRGCAWDCEFCSNASVFSRKVRYKSPERLVGELIAIRQQYLEPDVFGFYLISKTYGLNREVTREFGRGIASLPFAVQWRTQTRADVFDADLLPELSEAGLAVLDVGLESASPRMLIMMQKTRDPEFYLKSALKIIETAQSTQTKIKLNLLFHPGETPETIAETLEFLLPLRGKISAVTVSPVMVDPGAPLSQAFSYYERQFGASLVRSPMWDACHIHPANPSREISFEQVNVLSTLLSKMFQTRDDYLASRRLGGALRGLTKAELHARLENIPDHLKPYSL